MPTAVCTYADHIALLENPDEMPSEVARRLAVLLGCPHEVAHQALVKVNPGVWQNVQGECFLDREALGPVASEVTALLMAAAKAYRDALELTISIKKSQRKAAKQASIAESSDN